METTISTNQRITNTLLLNASFIDNLGLMHGKMGISIFFFHLARQTKNKIYEDYAGELIDEIYEEITANTPVDFENGLAGIGWGIEYLVQNGFIEADTDEVLEEFDNRIFKELIYITPKEIGLLNGIVGIGSYLLKRIQNPLSNDEKISTLTNKQTLIHLIDELDRRLTTIEIEKLLNCETETEEVGSRKPEVGSKTTETFDITWDYPILLWFLAELYQQNIFNFKVKKIINRLIEPLTNDNNLPKLHCNRLLLALTLIKLQQTTGTTKEARSRKSEVGSKGTTEISKLSNFQTISNNLLLELNRKTIKFELAPNNTTLRHGTSGIAYIYKQLFKLTPNSHYKKEMEYWIAHGKAILTQNKYDIDFGDSSNYNKTAYGVLEGDAGIALNHITCYNKKH